MEFSFVDDLQFVEKSEQARANAIAWARTNFEADGYKYAILGWLDSGNAFQYIIATLIKDKTTVHVVVGLQLKSTKEVYPDTYSLKAINKAVLARYADVLTKQLSP